MLWLSVPAVHFITALGVGSLLYMYIAAYKTLQRSTQSCTVHCWLDRTGRDTSICTMYSVTFSSLPTRRQMCILIIRTRTYMHAEWKTDEDFYSDSLLHQQQLATRDIVLRQRHDIRKLEIPILEVSHSLTPVFKLYCEADKTAEAVFFSLLFSEVELALFTFVQSVLIWRSLLCSRISAGAAKASNATVHSTCDVHTHPSGSPAICECSISNLSRHAAVYTHQKCQISRSASQSPNLPPTNVPRRQFSTQLVHVKSALATLVSARTCCPYVPWPTTSTSSNIPAGSWK